MHFWTAMHGLFTIGFCLLGSTAQGDASPSALIQKADRLYAEGLYNDAIPLYQQILQASPQSHQVVNLHLADCYLEISRPDAVLDLLATGSIPPQWEADRVYLISSAYRLLNQHPKALHLLLSLPKATDRNEIALEKGLNLFYLKQIPESRSHFQAIFRDPLKPLYYDIAQLYLARMALIENHTESASRLLKQIEWPSDHPLSYEKAYLEGLISFVKGDYHQSIAHFEQALPKQPKPCPWEIPTLRYMVSSYLHVAAQECMEKSGQSNWIEQAHPLLDKLLAESKEELDYLLLGDFYLIKAQQLQDEQAYREARLIFSNQNHFITAKTRQTAALKLAEALPTYAERKAYYQQLQELDQSEILFRQGWNEYKAGLSNSGSQSLAHFEEAFELFKQSYFLAVNSNLMVAQRSLKHSILASLLLPYSESSNERAFFLSELMERQDSLELRYLIGLLWKRNAVQDAGAFPIAEKILTQTSACLPSNQWTLRALKALGELQFQHGHWTDAETTFAKLFELQPNSSKALFWQALCAEKLGQQERKQMLLQKVYLKNPQDPVAPIAYFYTYNYREYLRGPRKAIRHLQTMPMYFADHPLLINAYYLIGMDLIKDHLSDEGTILRRKDCIAAIDAFHQAESVFQKLNEKKLISTQALPYFIQVRYRAMLERALANLTIADESHGAKQRIYLEYAETVFYQLSNELQNPTALIQEFFIKNDPYARLLQESDYWLAKTHLKRGQLAQADGTLDQALKRYEAAGLKRGYLLSRTWYEKGNIAQMRHDYQKAIECFGQAEAAAEGKTWLSPDQKLDLWIQQSLCYKELNELDQAMFLLSKAVNDEAICSLRVKAMFLRAEIYELQGRPELALKQLEAVSRKGGEWEKLAKEKLENNYGY